MSSLGSKRIAPGKQPQHARTALRLVQPGAEPRLACGRRGGGSGLRARALHALPGQRAGGHPAPDGLPVLGAAAGRVAVRGPDGARALGRRRARVCAAVLRPARPGAALSPAAAGAHSSAGRLCGASASHALRARPAPDLHPECAQCSLQSEWAESWHLAGTHAGSDRLRKLGFRIGRREARACSTDSSRLSGGLRARARSRARARCWWRSPRAARRCRRCSRWRPC